MAEIETERLTLRPYRSGDAALIHRLTSDLRVFFWRTEPGTLSEAEDKLASILASFRESGMGWWAVFGKGCKNDQDAFLGQVGLQPLPDSDFIEIAYHFAPQEWGNGFATESARAILDHGFRELHLNQIVAVILPDNKPSLRVIQRLAMPYIEDRMHANLTHRFFALTREAYISAHGDALEKA